MIDLDLAHRLQQPNIMYMGERKVMGHRLQQPLAISEIIIFCHHQAAAALLDVVFYISPG